MYAENIGTQADWHKNIRAVLCDVGGVLIHKRRTSALQQWEKALGCELPLAVWLCPAGRRAVVGQASVEDVWCELQQLYALTKTELEASDYLDTEFAEFLHEVGKVRKIALLSNAWPDARHVFPIFIFQSKSRVVVAGGQGFQDESPAMRVRVRWR